MYSIAHLLLGSNLEDPDLNLRTSIQLMDRQGIKVMRKSPVFRTSPWGNTAQKDFLNQVIEVTTLLSPRELLSQLLDIELEMGRVRKEKWGPRKIDIDILLYEDTIIDEPGLNIPHPELPNRRFALEPLMRLIPDKIHPVLFLSIRELLDRCPDPGQAIEETSASG